MPPSFFLSFFYGKLLLKSSLFVFYGLTQLCNHVWSGGGLGDAGEIKTLSGEHFPVNIPYFAWADLEPPPQTSVGFRTTLWEPQRGAACLPACLPRCSHRPRKYLGTSANRRLNLFCLPPPPFFFTPLPPPPPPPPSSATCIISTHTHSRWWAWSGRGIIPLRARRLSFSARLSLPPLPPLSATSRFSNAMTVEANAWADPTGVLLPTEPRLLETHTRARAHTHLEITMWLGTWAWRKSPILKPETLLLRSCPGRLSTGIDNRRVAPCFLRNSAFPEKEKKKKKKPSQDARGE